MPSYTTLITSIGNGEVGIGTTTTNTSIQDDASFEFGSTGYDINNTGSVDLLNDIILLGRITLGLSDGGANYPVTINTGEYNVGIKSSKPERTLDVVGSIRKTVYKPGEIIEKLCGICDGRTLTGRSGSYQLENVNSIFNLSGSYQDIPGSTITYTPPTGTKTVIYEFEYHESRNNDTYNLYHTKFFIDSDEVTKMRNTVYLTYQSGKRIGRYVIDCGANAENLPFARYTSWTSPKTLKLQMRYYSDSYETSLFNTTWWDGVASTQLIPPIITITAIA
jgi:hypothetical protein